MPAFHSNTLPSKRCAAKPRDIAACLLSGCSGMGHSPQVMWRPSPNLHARMPRSHAHPVISSCKHASLESQCTCQARYSDKPESGAGDTDTCSPGHVPAHVALVAACMVALTSPVEPALAAGIQPSSLNTRCPESYDRAAGMQSTPQPVIYGNSHVWQHHTPSQAPALICTDNNAAALQYITSTMTPTIGHTISAANIRTADLQLPMNGWLPISSSTPTVTTTRGQYRSHDGWWLLGHSPMMVLNKKHPVWWNLGVLVAANILGIQLVLALLKRLGDRSEPVTLLRLQLGLVHPPGGPGAKALAHLRERLAKLNSMIQMGQHGLWLIVEEAALELAANQQAAALADVEVVHLESKREAYSLFGELAIHEATKARAEELLAHAEGQGDCVVNWSSKQPAGKLAATEPEDDGSALVAWLMQQPHQTWDEESGCDDAMVVTFVVVARGHLQVPTRISTWQDACDILKQICGLSSDKLMAVDLTWAPSTDGTYLTRDSLLQDYANLRPINTQQRHHQHR